MYILLGGYSPYADNDPKMTVKRVAKGQYHPFSTDEVWNTVSDEAKDVIASCFKVTRSERITVQGLREHPWLAMDRKGLKKADLTETRSKLEENFKRKFKKAGHTVRATLRMQSLKKLTAGLSAAKEMRLQTESGEAAGGGGRGGHGSAFDSIEERTEMEEECEGGEGRKMSRGKAAEGSAKKYAAPPRGSATEE